jgi:hypothetical protein
MVDEPRERQGRPKAVLEWAMRIPLRERSIKGLMFEAALATKLEEFTHRELAQAAFELVGRGLMPYTLKQLQGGGSNLVKEDWLYDTKRVRPAAQGGHIYRLTEKGLAQKRKYQGKEKLATMDKDEVEKRAEVLAVLNEQLETELEETKKELEDAKKIVVDQHTMIEDLQQQLKKPVTMKLDVAQRLYEKTKHAIPKTSLREH